MSKTRLTSLEINRDADGPVPVFAPAVMTQAEIDAIPLDDLRAGGVVYNITRGNLQTYTFNGWEDFALSGGDTDPTFENITVTNTATINTATINTAIIGNLDVSGTTNVDGLTASGTISAPDIFSSGSMGVANANLSSLGVNATDVNADGTIYGKRPSGAFHFFDNAQTFVFGGTQTKLNLVTTSDYLNQFASLAAARLNYIGVARSPINVLVTFSFSGKFSVDGALSFDFFKNTVTPLSKSVSNDFLTDKFNAVSKTFVTSMATNDYLEVFVSGAAGTLSFMDYTLSITEI